jgi:hypothetical protein
MADELPIVARLHAVYTILNNPPSAELPVGASAMLDAATSIRELVDALTLLADLHDAAGMPNCAARKKARALLAELEKAYD